MEGIAMEVKALEHGEHKQGVEAEPADERFAAKVERADATMLAKR